MEAWILNEELTSIAIIDEFESFIWTDRYIGEGEFELYLPVAVKVFPEIQKERYLWIKESQKMMIIEDIAINTDAENGDHATITGRSLESFLHRRIVWDITTLSGNFQDGVERLLNENAIAPIDYRRNLPITFRTSKDPAITELTYDGQFRGEDLYDAIYTMCESFEIGFRIIPIFDVKPTAFFFELYSGADRTWDQTKNIPVVFSHKYENLLSSDFYESNRDWKTACLAVGEVNEQEYRLEIDPIFYHEPTGIYRRETFLTVGIEAGENITIPPLDANEDGTVTPQERRDYNEAVAQKALQQQGYISQLGQAGWSTLMELTPIKMFEGEIDYRVQFIYGKDFFIGDVVQVANAYGKEGKCRISELVMTHDSTGESLIPTFTTINESQTS